MRQADNRIRKPEKDAETFLTDATKSFQENVSRTAPIAGASYTLIGAILVLGLLGYALDHWLGTSPWFLLAGLLLGLVVGFYELAKVVWHQ